MGFFDKVKDILNEEDDDDFDEIYNEPASSFNRASRNNRNIEPPVYYREERHT